MSADDVFNAAVTIAREVVVSQSDGDRLRKAWDHAALTRIMRMANVRELSVDSFWNGTDRAAIAKSLRIVPDRESVVCSCGSMMRLSGNERHRPILCPRCPRPVEVSP